MAQKTPPQILLSLRLPERTVDITQSLGRIDFDDLRGEMSRTGGEVVWYGILTAAAKRRASQAELASRVVEARLAKKYRLHARQMSEKTTNDEIKEAVRLDPDYAAACEALFAAEEQASILESCKFALVQKQRDLNSATSAQAVQAERLHSHDDRPMRSPVTRSR